MKPSVVALRPEPVKNSSVERTDNPFRRVDWSLMLLAGLLLTVGIVAIWSERVAKKAPHPTSLSNKQGVAIILGLFAMFVVMSVDYKRLRQFVVLFYSGSLVLLVGVLLFGEVVNGARAWYSLGSFKLQPSEISKVVLVFTLSVYCSADRDEKMSYDRFIKALFILGIPMLLVLAQPDLGTASTFIATTMGMLLVAKVRARYIILITLLSAASVTFVVASDYLSPYQVARLKTFIDPNEKTWTEPGADGKPIQKSNKADVQQVKNAKEAVILGRLTGAGFGKGYKTASGIVPEQTTDFIFSAIAEQFGLLGGGIVLLLYLLIILRCLRISQIAGDFTGSLIAVGAASLFTWHVFQNVAMNIGMMPITGIPLPLVSYGGSSVIAFLALLGLVQNVHMYRGSTS
jgi:rod shape determining protein RodA